MRLIFLPMRRRNSPRIFSGCRALVLVICLHLRGGGAVDFVQKAQVSAKVRS
jgi:hypothetical protein